MALDIGTLVAKVKVDDGDFDQKTKGWSTRGAAIGSAFGNVAADAIGQAASAIGGLISEAMEASDATDKFKQSLSFAGLDTSTIEGLAKSTRAYADETVYSLSDVQSITAQLAANGVKDYDTLAMSLGNLNAASSGNAETYARLGSVITQTAGAGKLTTENWNQLAEAIPGASGLLQDALLQAGAYTGNFRDAMSEGQITAEEFNTAIGQLGNDPVAVEAAKSTETFEGSLGGLQAGIVGLISDIATKLKPTFTDIVNTMAGVVGWISANADWLGPLALGIGIVATAVGLWSAAQWILNVALTANPIGLIVVAIGLLIGAIILLVQNWDTVVAWISEVWGGFVNWLVEITEGIATWWNELWAGFASWVTEVWNGFINWIMSLMIGYATWLIGIGNGIASWWNGLWSGIGAFIQNTWNGFISFVMGIFTGYVSWVMGIANGFVSGWNAVWSRVGQIISDVWNNVVSFFAGIPGAINGLLSGAGQWLYSIGRDIIQGLWNGLKSIWESVSSWFESTFGGIIDTVAGIFGIASPSRVFREFGVNIGEGLIDGLDTMTDPIDAQFRDMLAVPPVGTSTEGAPVATTATTKVVNYYAAEHQSLSAEEALFAALGSPRVTGEFAGVAE